jgi:enterochelin esterase family protein
MRSDYWIYVPAQYDPNAPAALMVWQDGQGHVDRNGKAKTLNVIDNLTHEGKIPVMITVFVSPGMAGERRMRSTQYDRVDDTYARFLRDELLPEVEKKYALRKDSYSRAIAGVSSGGICSFNAAWQMPDQFSRVLSLIGSYTSIAGVESGGHLYPFKVRKEEVRNIRVWLQGGAGDLENAHGSWPLMNIQLANSLKFKGYDFHFSFGSGTHNTAHGFAELPRSMEWLWRGYDPALQQEVYVIDPEEQKQPMYRVRIVNR